MSLSPLDLLYRPMQEEFVRGMPITIPIEFIDTTTTPEQPVQIMDCKLVFTIKKFDDKKEDDSGAVFKTIVTEHEDPENGKTGVIIPYVITKDFIGDYKFDFVLLDQNDQPLFWMKKGLMKFDDNVTKILVDNPEA